MIALKGCPRCRGDLFLEEDATDAHWSCLQCGYTGYSNLPARSQAVNGTPVEAMRFLSRHRNGCAALVLRDDGQDGDLARVLTSLGCQVAAAGSYEEGERLLERYPFQVVLMEAYRPSIGVLAMAKRIRAHWPDAVLALVVAQWEADEEELAFRSADRAVRRPVPLVWLAQLLEEAACLAHSTAA